MNPLSQLSRLLKRGDGKIEAPPWNCCSEPRQGVESVDMGHANSFEMSLTSCASCGARWASLFCVANGKSGWERVTDDEAKSLLASIPGTERKALLRAWIDKNT